MYLKSGFICLTGQLEGKPFCCMWFGPRKRMTLIFRKVFLQDLDYWHAQEITCCGYLRLSILARKSVSFCLLFKMFELIEIDLLSEKVVSGNGKVLQLCCPT